MTENLSEIAGTIQNEAKAKYDPKKLVEQVEGLNPEVFLELVEFFKAQNESHPHLEAFEIYLMVEENLPSKNPSKAEIRQVISDLLGVD
jgi:hypothetical protein